MDVQIFLKHIQAAFSSPLPGPTAHQLLTPGKRPMMRMEVENIDEYRASAVAIVCFPKDNQVHVLLTQRPDYDGTHGGQISFPGGKKEQIDTNLEQTARRETFEEIGWTLTTEECMGEMTEIFIPLSRFSVQSYLYYTEQPQTYQLDPREVAEVIEFPLELLIDNSIIKSTNIRYATGLKLKNVPYFDINGKIVWGATAIVLSELKMMIQKFYS